MGDGLLYLTDHITENDLTFDFTPEFEGDKVTGVTVTVYDCKLWSDELDEAEPISVVSLDAEGWTTLLSWVRAALEAKKI